MKKTTATAPGLSTLHEDMKPDEIAAKQVADQKEDARIAKMKADRDKAKIDKQNSKNAAEQRIKTKFGWTAKDLDDLKEIFS